MRVAPPTDGVLQLSLMPQPLHARHATNSHVTKFYLLSWIWTSGCEAFHGKSYDQTMHSTEETFTYNECEVSDGPSWQTNVYFAAAGGIMHQLCSSS